MNAAFSEASTRYRPPPPAARDAAASTSQSPASPVSPSAVSPSAAAVAFAVAMNTSSESLSVEPLMDWALGAKDGCVHFSLDGTRLAIGTAETVHVMSLEEGATVRLFPRPSRVRAVALSGCGESLLIGGFDKQISMHRIDEGARLYLFPSEEKTSIVYSIATTRFGQPPPPPDEPMSLSTSRHRARRQHRSSRRRTSGEPPPLNEDSHHSRSRFPAGSTAGSTAAAAAEEAAAHRSELVAVGGESATGGGFAHLFDSESLDVLCEWKRDKPVHAVALTRDGTQCAVGGRDNKVIVYDVQLNAEVSYLHMDPHPKTGIAFIWALAFSPSDNRLAVGSWNGLVHVYRNDLDEAATDTQSCGAYSAESDARLEASDPQLSRRAPRKVNEDALIVIQRPNHLDEATSRVYSLALTSYGERCAAPPRDERTAGRDASVRLHAHAHPLPAHVTRPHAHVTVNVTRPHAHVHVHVPRSHAHVTRSHAHFPCPCPCTCRPLPRVSQPLCPSTPTLAGCSSAAATRSRRCTTCAR